LTRRDAESSVLDATPLGAGLGSTVSACACAWAEGQVYEPSRLFTVAETSNVPADGNVHIADAVPLALRSALEHTTMGVAEAEAVGTALTETFAGSAHAPATVSARATGSPA
jgi:hypothetical protein